MANQSNLCCTSTDAAFSLWRRVLICCFVALCLSALVSVMAAKAGPTGMQLQGVNISGAEWAPQNVPGVFGVDYIYPKDTEIDHFADDGMTVIRIPILWERMQPQANGPFDPAELSRLDAVVAKATSRGLATIIDSHNYGAYRNVTIGVSGGQPNSMFANFWSQMALHYRGNSKVIFGLMNEPVGASMTATTWEASAQAGIDAIRATGATNLILVPSTFWEHSVNFVELNASAMINITDPANNYSYDVHQYLDYDGSGSHQDFLSPSDSVATLNGFTAWLKANNRTAFLSEIGVTSNPGALASLSAMLQYMHANPDQWTGYTYWSAGPWWQSYMFGVEPVNGVDTPQMNTLIANLGSQTPPETPPPPPPTPPPVPPLPPLPPPPAPPPPVKPPAPPPPVKPPAPPPPVKPPAPPPPVKPPAPPPPVKPPAPPPPVKPPAPPPPVKPPAPPPPAKPPSTGKHAQPGHAQPGHAQPGHAQPGHAQPGHAQPGHAQPGHAQPGHAQPGHAQPGHAQEGHAQEGHAQ